MKMKKEDSIGLQITLTILSVVLLFGLIWKKEAIQPMVVIIMLWIYWELHFIRINK